MKKNKLLLLSLLASTLLVGCDESTFVQNGSNPVGTVEGVDKDGATVTLETTLKLQDLYEDLKSASGGSKAVEVLIEKLSKLEYSDENLENGFTPDGGFDVRNYHSTASLKADIAEFFEDVYEGKNYLDEDGKFDKNAYKEYVEETLDFEVTEGESKYLDAELSAKLGYNYDEYIEETIIPDILESYIYLDYVTGSSKYKGQFSNQYAVNFEVLKIAHDTTKLNGEWNEALIRDVKAVTSGNLEGHAFGSNYSFVTFNSDNDMIVFESTTTALTYSVYANSAEIDAIIDSMLKTDKNNPTNIKQVKFDDARVSYVTSTATPTTTWTINSQSVANEVFYQQVEDVLIARDLWKIDREVVLARNYDYKTPLYQAMTETEKNEAKGFADTYSNSNAKPLKEVAKAKKVSAQQTAYYTEADYYTKSTYTSVLPTALSSLRGSSAKDIQANLITFGDDSNFLLPNKDTLADPVYLDTSSNYYYICEVYEWYGFYKNENVLDTNSKYKSISNYQIEAYQKGAYSDWTYDSETNKYVEGTPIVYSEHPEAFTSIIELVQVSAENILTEAMKKEAIISLLEKYGLEINDQDIYDYVSEQYPDYFDDED